MEWDELFTIASKIQGILDKLIRSPDGLSELTALQQTLNELWESYQKVGQEARELTIEEDDRLVLDSTITKAMKAYNIASQGIANRLEK